MADTATYQITGPGGEVFEIHGPGSFQDALSALGLGAPPAPPSIDSSEFDKSVAEKYGASPEFVARAKKDAAGSAMLGGIPIAGAYVPNAAAALEAISPTGNTAPGDTFSERYTKNLGIEREIDEAYHREHPGKAIAAGLVGGAGALGGLGATALGARLLGAAPGAGLMARTAGGAASGAAIGGADAAARGSDITTGAVLGGALGGAVPVAGRLLGAAAAPIVSNIRARLNPQAYAERQVARAITESGQTPQQIAQAVQDARYEGQGEFTPADAMGNAGQRMLSTVARAPGEGRQMVTDFLEGRQAGQGRRIANQLAEGFDAPLPAAQVAGARTAARDAQANVEYAAARQNAQPVDLRRTVNMLDQEMAPRPATLAPDSIDAALAAVRNRMVDANGVRLTDFRAVQRFRNDLADLEQQAVNRGQGNRARILGNIRRSLDQDMERASPGFMQANRNFEAASRDIDAIAEGRNAALRGRSENTIPAYRNLGPGGQSAFRAGYADPLIEQVQGGAVGVNKARPFTSDAFQAEAAGIAPRAPIMQRQLARENTMFDTRNHALGGSRTADNLADSAAMGVDPSLIGNILSGNFQGALHQAIGKVSNGITGNTQAVRRAVADILLSRNLPPAEFQRMLDQTVQHITQVQHMAQNATRTLAGVLSTRANQALAP